mmetsp:Transcript_74313/g.120711  ORF Transcript_74313/g.120711 Transcript_74313/m.120711 type:complete len:213 (-) Transcript_74313:352-990(-)
MISFCSCPGGIVSKGSRDSICATSPLFSCPPRGFTACPRKLLSHGPPFSLPNMPCPGICGYSSDLSPPDCAAALKAVPVLCRSSDSDELDPTLLLSSSTKALSTSWARGDELPERPVLLPSSDGEVIKSSDSRFDSPVPDRMDSRFICSLRTCSSIELWSLVNFCSARREAIFFSKLRNVRCGHCITPCFRQVFLKAVVHMPNFLATSDSGR